MTMMGLPYRVIVSAYSPAGVAVFHQLEFMGKTLGEAVSNMTIGLTPHLHGQEQAVSEASQAPTKKEKKSKRRSAKR